MNNKINCTMGEDCGSKEKWREDHAEREKKKTSGKAVADMPYGNMFCGA